LQHPDWAKFFRPKSVAVIGATADRARFGGKVMQRLRQFGCTGAIYPVNPSSTEIDGLTCYAGLRDLPEVPEHVGIMVPTSRIFGVLEDCAALGVPFATIFSSGFAETGTAEGRALQARLTSFARDTGVRIMGPNCNGMINFVDGFAFTSTGTVAGGRRLAGRIGLAAQSGGAAQVNVMWRAQQSGLELSYEVSCGNSADLDVLDFAGFLVDDPHTDVIMILAEVLRTGAKLFDVAARAAARGKPIVMLKLGRTEIGSRAAASHTGVLTGSDAVHDAAFRQCGIIRVDDCNELYETAMLLQTKRLPQGEGLAALSASGGNAVIMADLGSRIGIQWPAYSAETQAALRALLPQHGQANNPTDVTSAIIGKPDTYRRVVETIAADAGVDAVVPVLTMSAASDIAQVCEGVRNIAKPAAILWTGGCIDDPAVTPASLVAQGIAVYRDAASCLRAMRATMDYAAFQRRATRGSRWPEGGSLPVLLAGRSTPLGEREAKEALAAYGFSVLRETLATTADAAVEAARTIGGKVALKISSPQILHKTEAGGVRLGVVGDEAVRAAFEGIVASALRHAAGAEIEGVLVQAMAPTGGIELILGVAADVTFGKSIMVGFGGIHAEVLHDVALRVPPVDEDEALRMLRELRGFPILQGVRGQAPKDIDAVCRAISTLSWLALECGDALRELDINPLMVYDAGAAVIDALIVPEAAP
jgi:acetate---CoA ligase (ADP-forming)